MEFFSDEKTRKPIEAAIERTIVTCGWRLERRTGPGLVRHSTKPAVAYNRYRRRMGSDNACRRLSRTGNARLRELYSVDLGVFSWESISSDASAA
jgi:hypothetical protein